MLLNRLDHGDHAILNKEGNKEMRELPKELVDQFVKLADRFELIIRQDERDQLINKLRGTLFAEQIAEAEIEEPPLPESVLQPNDDVELTSTHYCAIRWMSQGFIAVPTLAGHMGVQKRSVYSYLSDLRKAGYEIEAKNTGNNRGGYYKIYRLARSA